MTERSLFMLQLPLDGRRVTAFALAHGLDGDIRDGDGGYAAHALLAALFGPQAPKPFVLQPRPRMPGAVDLLAYSPVPLAVLKAQADLTAPPLAHAAVDWSGAADKAMPTALPPGLALGFQVRVCPTVRLARGAQDKSPGSEVDAFLAALDRPSNPTPGLDRQAIYRDWLLARLPGAAVLDLRLDSLRQISLTRRAAPVGDSRPLTSIRKPDALFTGRLQVADSAQFMDTLTRGVGRHRAFGFGMLLLQPAR